VRRAGRQQVHPLLRCIVGLGASLGEVIRPSTGEVCRFSRDLVDGGVSILATDGVRHRIGEARVAATMRVDASRWRPQQTRPS
jgi:hypothetical protein